MTTNRSKVRKTLREASDPKLAYAVVQFANAVETMLLKRAQKGGEEDDDDDHAPSPVRPRRPQDPKSGLSAIHEPDDPARAAPD
jgi:hypothetical protein